MILHPLALSLFMADAAAAASILAAGATALRITLHWRPGSAEREQLSLEAAGETAALLARIGMILFAATTGLFLLMITNILPSLVPGAMCGTGVMQAMDGYGGRALGFRLVSVAVLYIWYLLETLNRTRPEAPLTPLAARVLLAAVPVVLLGSVEGVRSFRQVDVHQPVSCCAVVYDAVGGKDAAGADAETAPPPMIAFLTLGAALSAAAARLAWGGPRGRRGIGGIVLVLGLIWPPVAVAALVRGLSAYHYQVLHHRCPWCLFLPDHGLVGFLLFGALFVVCLEGICARIALAIGERHPEVVQPAVRRLRRSGRRVFFATVVFLAVSGLPALLWRWRFGVWIG